MNIVSVALPNRVRCVWALSDKVINFRPNTKLCSFLCQIKAKKPQELARHKELLILQVIHRLPALHLNEELHHSGWNACSR